MKRIAAYTACIAAILGTALMPVSVTAQEKSLKDQLVGTWVYDFEHDYASRWHEERPAESQGHGDLHARGPLHVHQRRYRYAKNSFQ